jgi:hypothetical protein
MSAATDLVFIIAGRVNIIVIKAGPIVAPVCARITNETRRNGRKRGTPLATVRRHTLADCGTGLGSAHKISGSFGNNMVSQQSEPIYTLLTEFNLPQAKKSGRRIKTKRQRARIFCLIAKE